MALHLKLIYVWLLWIRIILDTFFWPFLQIPPLCVIWCYRHWPLSPCDATNYFRQRENLKLIWKNYETQPLCHLVTLSRTLKCHVLLKWLLTCLRTLSAKCDCFAIFSHWKIELIFLLKCFYVFYFCIFDKFQNHL